MVECHLKWKRQAGAMHIENLEQSSEKSSAEKRSHVENYHVKITGEKEKSEWFTLKEATVGIHNNCLYVHNKAVPKSLIVFSAFCHSTWKQALKEKCLLDTIRLKQEIDMPGEDGNSFQIETVTQQMALAWLLLLQLGGYARWLPKGLSNHTCLSPSSFHEREGSSLWPYSCTKYPVVCQSLHLVFIKKSLQPFHFVAPQQSTSTHLVAGCRGAAIRELLFAVVPDWKAYGLSGTNTW